MSVPSGAAFEAVHRIIYDELVNGVIRPESRGVYLEVVDDLTRRGTEAIILGCTEIELLIQDADADVPLLEPHESTPTRRSTWRWASPTCPHADRWRPRRPSIGPQQHDERR